MLGRVSWSSCSVIERKAHTLLYRRHSTLRQSLDSFATRHGIETQTQWYNIRSAEVKANSAELVKYLMGSGQRDLAYALRHVYREYTWHPWLFEQCPIGYWNDMDNQKRYFDWFAEEKELMRQADWYLYGAQEVKDTGGYGLIHTRYEDSFMSALETVYPQFVWQPWRSRHCKQGFWKDVTNHRRFFEWFSSEHEVYSQEQWYRVTWEALAESGGRGMLSCYNNSLYHALQVVYPEYVWLPWRLQQCPQGYWKEPLHHRAFFDWLGGEIQLESTEGWYGVTQGDVASRGGSGLLQIQYGGSFVKAITTIYSEFPWRGWLFENCPRGFWMSSANVNQYIAWLQQKLGVVAPQDWCSITKEQVQDLSGGRLVQQFGGWLSLLALLCPSSSYSTIASKVQLQLFKMLQQLFPTTQIELNYKHPQLRYPHSEELMELDIYLPTLSLALEYQGQQHYTPSHFFSSGGQQLQSRDQAKHRACQIAGITLVVIPHWWDRSLESLSAALTLYRSDLLLHNNNSRSSTLLLQAEESVL